MTAKVQEGKLGWNALLKVRGSLEVFEPIQLDAAGGELGTHSTKSLAQVVHPQRLEELEKFKWEIQEQADKEWKSSVDAGFKNWKAWAVEATAGSAKAAHGFSRIVDEEAEPF